ncbi:MAG TPA: hypothetical protein VEB66_00620 [Opitutaceae bacterium]|nr:hypothetical protein [Opitutaceae bacterium]
MKSLVLSLRTPLIELRSALARHGRRTREDFEELVLDSADCHGRVTVRPHAEGHRVLCSLDVEESRLIPSGLDLFNQLALDGHPLVAFGAGRGQVTFRFEWVHPQGAAWRISAERVEILIGQLVSSLCAKPAVFRPSRRISPRRAELLDGVIAHVSAA